MLLGITGFVIALYAAVSIVADSRARSLEKKRLTCGSSFTAQEDWFVKFAQQALRKFALGGTLAVLALWSGQNWGAYTTLVLMTIDIVRQKVLELDK